MCRLLVELEAGLSVMCVRLLSVGGRSRAVIGVLEVVEAYEVVSVGYSLAERLMVVE